MFVEFLVSNHKEATMFKVIESRVPISKVVARQIEGAIMNKSYMPGSKLPSEFELCKQFGVSRTAIREALQTLSAQNMITIIKGKGIFVSEMSSSSIIEPMNKYFAQKLDKDYILDLVHSRQVIEPSLAEMAAERRTEKDIENLHRDFNALENFEGTHAELARLDMAFHLTIARASHNRILPVILEPILISFMPEVKTYIYDTVSDVSRAASNHKPILDAIIKGDSIEARNAMNEHLIEAQDHAKRMIEARYNSEEDLVELVEESVELADEQTI